MASVGPLYNEFTEQTKSLKPSGDGSGMDAINSWWDKGHTLFRNNPEAFQRWSQENPEMAIRWHARAGNKNVNTGWDNKKHKQMAQSIALGHSLEQGYGEDMKQDGRMLAFDYDTFKDVNNEWGEGDFWKIGTMQTLDKGFGNFIDNLDLKDVAMMAAPFIAGPLLGPALASMGLSPAVTGAMSNMMMQGLKGGDLKDILISGATPFVNNALGSFIDKGLYGTKLGDSLLQKGWDLNAISKGVQSGGMDFLKGKGLDDAILGGLEEYIDAGGGLGNLPGPGIDLPDFNLPDFNFPDFGLPEFGDGDGLFGDVEIPEWLKGLGDINLPDFDMPGMPDWQGPDWNPQLPEWAQDLPGIPGVDLPGFDLPNVDLPNMPGMPGMPQGGGQGMMAAAPAPKVDPTEMAKLYEMQQLQGLPVGPAPWLNPQGMMKA